MSHVIFHGRTKQARQTSEQARSHSKEENASPALLLNQRAQHVWKVLDFGRWTRSDQRIISSSRIKSNQIKSNQIKSIHSSDTIRRNIPLYSIYCTTIYLLYKMTTNDHGPPPNYYHDVNNSVMERVLFQLHHRICHFGLLRTSGRSRRLAEHVLLVVAILGSSALVLLHRSFVFRGSHNANCAATCLPSIIQQSQRNMQMNMNMNMNMNMQAPTRTTVDLLHVVLLPFDNTNTNTSMTQESRVVWKNPSSSSSSTSFTCPNTDTNTNTNTDTNTNTEEKEGTTTPSFLPDDATVLYSYSTTKAYLLLPSNHPLLNQLSIQYIYAAPHDPNCFGEPFLQELIHRWIGYDTIVLNWLLALDATPTISTLATSTTSTTTTNPTTNTTTTTTTTKPPPGYVYHPKTGRLQELSMPASFSSSYSSSSDNKNNRNQINSHNSHNNNNRFRGGLPPVMSKLAVLVQTSFLFFFSTTLVSFTLRETQERMLEFTQELSRRVSMSLPLRDLITRHVLHNLLFVPIMVGMMFFLIEFYSGDKFLAFLVMTIVWCVEAFSVVRYVPLIL
jgi:hypothetical protein